MAKLFAGEKILEEKSASAFANYSETLTRVLILVAKFFLFHNENPLIFERFSLFNVIYGSHSRTCRCLKFSTPELCLWKQKLRTIHSPSSRDFVCFYKLIKIDFSHFSFVLPAVFHVKVESNVDIFRAFTLFFRFTLASSVRLLASVLLLIQTERTIHYKSLFYNERHSFRGSRVKAHTAHTKKFIFFLLRLSLFFRL